MVLGNKCFVCGSKDYEVYQDADGTEYGKCFNVKCIMSNWIKKRR